MKLNRLILPLVLLAMPAMAYAQSTFGSVVGVTQDTNLAVVPEATITIKNLDENSTRSTTSNNEGGFQFLNLKPGRYQITATKSGFSDFKTAELLLEARQAMRVEIKFQVAAIGVSVDVTADSAAAINTESGTIGATKSFQQLTQLPVNYRGATTSPLAAISTMPSVQQDNNGNLSIGGALPSQVGYSVDGVSTSNNRQNGALPNLYPSSEILSEFKVTAFNNNAEFSQIGDVTVTTKGGGNQYHGSLFEYHQDSTLDARVYGFDTKAPKTFNTFGGSFSGPVSIPRLYNGKDRTFFFVDYEGNRRRTSTPLQFLVPTADQRAGNLSSLTSNPIIDPMTGETFAGNIIPEPRISQTARTLLDNYYPLPNNTGNPNANLFLLTPVPSNTDGYDVRIDHNLNKKQSVYARWSWKNITATSQNGLLPSEQTAEHNRNLLISHNYTITSNLINEFRFGISRFSSQVSFPIRGADALAQLGISGLDLSDHPENHAFPIFNFSDSTGFATIGRDKTGVTRSSTTQFTDNLTWIKGRHTMRFGVDIKRLGYNDLESFGGANDFGQWVFSAGQFTGDAFADFLLGLPTFTYVAQSGPDIDASTSQYSMYAQDEWRINDRLTLSAGLRYTIMPPFADKNGNLGAFNYADGGMIIPDKLEPRAEFLRSINACGTGPNGQGLDPNLKCVSIQKASEAGLPQGLRQIYYGNLQPRLSFAYRPFKNDKTVIRGGFGIFTMTNLGQLSFNITDIASSVVRTYTNADPLTGAPRYQFPSPFYSAATQEFIGSSDFYQNTPTNYKDPQSAQWNLTIERELPADLALRVSYVGMNSYRMNLTVDLNQVPPSTGAYDPTLKPYQNWNRILSSENLGYANYQALQTELNRRLKNGVSFQASYTWAKNLADYGGDAPSGFAPEVIYGTAVNDRFDLRDVRGNVAGTRRHRFLVSGLYELPLGKGKPFFAKMSPVLNGLLGGWQLSTVTMIETGPFLTPTYSAGLVDPANINTFNRGSILRPDVIGNGNIDQPTPDHYFDINAFTAPTANAGRIGDAGVGILVGPGTVAISGGLSKTFMVTERVKLRFEMTFTNLPNHTNFAAPAVDVSTPATFGRTTAVQTAEGAGNRVGQLSLRLEF
ncbi:MAG: TonB-dependent receptor [Blastocatellia bacterium]|nr:TonB-dependent receptor [Blastocatellia bacterium]